MNPLTRTRSPWVPRMVTETAQGTSLGGPTREELAQAYPTWLIHRSSPDGRWQAERRTSIAPEATALYGCEQTVRAATLTALAAALAEQTSRDMVAARAVGTLP